MKKIVAFVFSFVIISLLFSIRIMHPLGFGCTCPVVDNFYTPINLFAIAASSVILTGIFWGIFFTIDYLIQFLVALVRQNRHNVEKLDKEENK